MLQWSPILAASTCFKSGRGVGMIEFALMAPVVAFLLIGALDFGRMAMERSAVGAAARSGALYAALNAGSAPGAIQDAALAGAGDESKQRQVASRYFCICPSTGEIVCSLACPEGGRPARFGEVTVSTRMETLVPYPGVASPLTIEQTVRVQVM